MLLHVSIYHLVIQIVYYYSYPSITKCDFFSFIHKKKLIYTSQEITHQNNSKGISEPLVALQKRLVAFEQGDLSSDFPVVDSQDEIKDMTETAAEMAASLKEIIYDCNYILGEMSKGNYGITSKAKEKYVGDYAGSDNLAQAAQALAEESTDQSAAVEELQATIAN